MLQHARRLSATVALAAAAHVLVACSGSGNGEEVVTVRLASDEPCYGIAIDVDERGLSAPNSGTVHSCTAAAELLSRGCELDTSITNDEYRISVTGCFAPSGTDLVECTLPKALAERFRNDTEIRCGCGCAEDCPSVVAAVVCDEDDHCAEPQAFAVAQLEAAHDDVQTDYGIAQETTVASSTTFCGTCCDAGVDPGIASTSGGTIREIRFDLTFPSGDGCDFPSCSVEADDIDGPVAFRNGASPELVHVCLSSKEGFANPTDLLDCTADTGGDDEFQISNVAALNARLEPISPPPVLVNDAND